MPCSKCINSQGTRQNLLVSRCSKRARLARLPRFEPPRKGSKRISGQTSAFWREDEEDSFDIPVAAAAQSERKEACRLRRWQEKAHGHDELTSAGTEGQGEKGTETKERSGRIRRPTGKSLASPSTEVEVNEELAQEEEENVEQEQHGSQQEKE